MAKSGPQKYPGASTSYWYGSKYPGSAMESNVVVWHSTEGRSLPSYGGGASAPNFTAVPDLTARRLRWYQHFDFDVSSRALQNLRGGVETNTLNVVQVELVGTCDSRHAKTWRLGSKTYKAGTDYLYTGDLPDWVVRDLAAFCRWAYEKHGVPLTSGVTFKAYPDSYGANGVRMSGAKWQSFKGHCGHQHVPENDHGDPGAFPMAAILAAAKGADEDDGGPTAGGTYTVKRGDTLYRIAREHSTTADALAKLNGIKDPGALSVGQKLTLPAGATEPRTYKVKAGDTLWGIAADHLGNGGRYTEIARLNGLGTSVALTPGQILKIPAK